MSLFIKQTILHKILALWLSVVSNINAYLFIFSMTLYLSGTIKGGIIDHYLISTWVSYNAVALNIFSRS